MQDREQRRDVVEQVDLALAHPFGLPAAVLIGLAAYRDEWAMTSRRS
jgi:hypothetical protein